MLRPAAGAGGAVAVVPVGGRRLLLRTAVAAVQGRGWLEAGWLGDEVGADMYRAVAGTAPCDQGWFEQLTPRAWDGGEGAVDVVGLEDVPSLARFLGLHK